MVAVLEPLIDANESNWIINGVFLIANSAKHRDAALKAFIVQHCRLIASHEKKSDIKIEINGVDVISCGNSDVMVLKNIHTMLTNELTSTLFIESLLETRRTMKLPLIITGNHQAEEILLGFDSFVKDFKFIHSRM